MKSYLAIAVASAATRALADVVPQVEAIGKCNPLHPGHPVLCDRTVTVEDITLCGSKEFPCITSGGECGECFKATYRQPDVDDATVCASGTCPGYEAVVYLKAGDQTIRYNEFSMAQAGWEKICPYACMGSEICVQHPKDCLFGVYQPKSFFDADHIERKHPGSCDVRELEISVEKMECEDAGFIQPVFEIQPVDEGVSAHERQNAQDVMPPDVEIQPVDNVTGQCNVFQFPHTVSCLLHFPVEKHNVQGCGDSAANPCYASGTMEQCGKCYRIDYTQDNVNSDSCTDGKCEGFTSSAYVRIADGSARAQVDIGIAQGAWGKLCPQICKGTETCVKNISDCANGTEDGIEFGELTYSGSCMVSKKELSMSEVPCEASILPVDEVSAHGRQNAQDVMPPDVVIQPVAPVSAQCNVFQFPHTVDCAGHYPVEKHNVQGCGDSAANPCYSSGPLEECGKCFMLTYTRANIRDAVCMDGLCEGFTKTAYVQVADSSNRDQVDVGVAQGAWRNLCPHICKGTEICVATRSMCAQGTEDDVEFGELNYPGSCMVSKLGEVERVEVPCEASIQPVDDVQHH